MTEFAQLTGCAHFMTAALLAHRDDGGAITTADSIDKAIVLTHSYVLSYAPFLVIWRINRARTRSGRI